MSDLTPSRISPDAYVSSTARISGNAHGDGNAIATGDALLTGRSLYAWTAFKEADTPGGDPTRVVFQYGCERHSLETWTPEFILERCAHYSEPLEDRIKEIVSEVRAHFSDFLKEAGND